MTKKVTILLTTYQGEKYITKQIDSILFQTYSNWELWIRDDCSADNTPQIISEFAAKDTRINILENKGIKLGACQNFAQLMASVDCNDYIMFCDQDDIWFDSKIAESVDSIKKLEEKSSDGCFCYGTYKLIDAFDTEIQQNSPDYSIKPALNLLINQNYVYGCTMIINKALLKLALPIPIAAENHDYWITLVAAYFNLPCCYITKPLLFYRQHGNNVSGSYKDSGFRKRLKRIIQSSDIVNIHSRLKMLNKLSEIPRLAPEKNAILVKDYCINIIQFNLTKVPFLIRNKIRRRTLFQTFSFYLTLINNR